jgi:hypothetical protein
VIASPLPPVPRVELTLTLGDARFDLRWRALVGAVVPAPRFAREGEVLASVRAAGQAGADLAVASLPPRLIGPATRAGYLPIAANVSSLEAAEVATGAGAALILVPIDLATEAVESGWTVALRLDDLADIDRARSVVDDHRLPLAMDTSAIPTPGEALAVESVAIPSGCRLVCTSDVRRTRRVVETMAALLAARREQADRP